MSKSAKSKAEAQFTEGSAAASEAGSSGEGAAGGTITMLTNAEQWQHVDPQRMYTGADIAFFSGYTTRTLTQYAYAPGAEGTELIADMATDTGTANEDATSWSFTIRDGVSFEDGAAVFGLMIATVGILLAWATWDMPNKTALWTYCILWAMRTSAKLNLFLGARNLSEEFLPDHMRYLASYFRKANINFLFPFVVMIGTGVVVLLAELATAATAGEFTRTSNLILATLLALAILEHWLMMLPLPAERLWSWGLASRQKKTSALPGLGKIITPAE